MGRSSAFKVCRWGIEGTSSVLFASGVAGKYIKIIKSPYRCFQKGNHGPFHGFCVDWMGGVAGSCEKAERYEDDEKVDGEVIGHLCLWLDD